MQAAVLNTVEANADCTLEEEREELEQRLAMVKDCIEIAQRAQRMAVANSVQHACKEWPVKLPYIPVKNMLRFCSYFDEQDPC